MVHSALAGSAFPYGTLVVNVTGCFAGGLISQLMEVQGDLGPGTRAFLVVGVLGGYTTFSAFGNETVNLMRNSQPLAAGMNVGGQLVLALCAVFLGRLTAHLIWR